MGRAIILDTETDNLNGRAIEIAYFPLDLSSGVLLFDRHAAFNQRYNPLRPISLDAMAVHNIIEQDVQGMPAYNTFTLDPSIKYIVGHNVDYDVHVLHRSGVTQDLKPIDTLAMARRIFPKAPRHTLAVLSYYISSDHAKVREHMRNNHSALTDVYLTASLLRTILQHIPPRNKQTIHDLYLFSLECRVPEVMPFGQYRGTAISSLPESYKQSLMKDDKTDLWVKFALELQDANKVRRAYEISKNCVTNTYSDYQFLHSRTPEETSKTAIYEAVLMQSLKADR